MLNSAWFCGFDNIGCTGLTIVVFALIHRWKKSRCLMLCLRIISSSWICHVSPCQVRISRILYNVAPPSDVCWLTKAPVTIVIRCYLRTINHSYWSYKPTNWTLSWPGASHWGPNKGATPPRPQDPPNHRTWTHARINAWTYVRMDR